MDAQFAEITTINSILIVIFQNFDTYSDISLAIFPKYSLRSKLLFK